MLLSPSYKTIELSTLVDNKKEYKLIFKLKVVPMFTFTHPYNLIIKMFQKAVKPNRWFESKKMNN